jgi:hypothetical protein
MCSPMFQVENKGHRLGDITSLVVFCCFLTSLEQLRQKSEQTWVRCYLNDNWFAAKYRNITRFIESVQAYWLYPIHFLFVESNKNWRQKKKTYLIIQNIIILCNSILFVSFFFYIFFNPKIWFSIKNWYFYRTLYFLEFK